jgi:hypothetical protein
MTVGLLTTHDAARVVGLAPQTLATLRMEGRGPNYVKLGRRVLYDPADLTAWVNAHKRRSTGNEPAALLAGAGT